MKHDLQGVPVPPHEFICPLTHEIMSDPVTLLTGMTYDRHSIKNWIDLGHTTCPMTQKVSYCIIWHCAGVVLQSFTACFPCSGEVPFTYNEQDLPISSYLHMLDPNTAACTLCNSVDFEL